MPSLPAGTFPSTYDNSQHTSFERIPGAGYLTTAPLGGSAYFDGTGDYLETPSSLDFTMGTGDFTVECWFKPAFDTSVDNTYHAYMWEIGNQRVYITIDNGTLYLANAFIGALANVSIGNIQNQWHHVAVTKASNVYTLWYDGQSQGTASDSNSITGPTGNESLIFRIANHTYWATTNYEFNGYISNMRVIKGTAIYTSAFTPSTSPLTAISGTVLLTCQNSTGTITDASSSNHTMTVYGNAAANTSTPFSGSTTASFNLLGYDSANSLERFTTGTVYNFGGGGLLTKVLTRDSQTSFAFNVGDSDNSTVGGSTKLLGGHDSANSVDKFASGTIYNFGGGGLLERIATRPVQNTFGGNIGSLADSGGSVGGGGGGGGGGGASSYEFVIIT